MKPPLENGSDLLIEIDDIPLPRASAPVEFAGTVTKPPTLQRRLEALKERHAALELQIAGEDRRLRPDSERLTRLKIEKLRVKEEIERIRVQNQ